jgi:Terminase RNaseH-like domain
MSADIAAQAARSGVRSSAVTLKLTIPRPHEQQERVLREAKRFNALCCGRRWGKTTIGQQCVIRPALAGKRTAWFSPTYRLLSDAWRSLVSTLQPVTARKNEAEHRLELLTGGSLECWSLDNPDAGRGRAYHQIVIDEAAIVRDLEQAWQESIRPMLSDFRGGAWFLSTPKGTANYFHALYQRGQDGAEGWASWRMPTRTNPYILESEIAAAKEDLTDLAFAQEYLAEFVTWAGQVFRRITEAVRPVGSPHAPPAIIGVDWGRTADSTVFTVVSQAGEVIEIDRFRGMEYSLQRARLKALWERHGSRAWIMAEVNSMGAPVVEQLQRDGLPVVGFVTTAPSKAAIIEGLCLAFERGAITIPDDPVLVGELQAFEAKPMPSGIMRYSAPAGQHDDCVMSLAFAWAGLTAPREQRQYLDPTTGVIGGSPSEYRISPI